MECKISHLNLGSISPSFGSRHSLLLFLLFVFAHTAFAQSTIIVPENCNCSSPIFDPAIVTEGMGSFGGRLCFDIAQSNDNPSDCGLLSGRSTQRADFTKTVINTQVYTFTPPGLVSNVRFHYINTNGEVIESISGDNPDNNISMPVEATVKYKSTLNTDAAGTTRANPLEAEIYVVYNINAINNNDPADDRIVKLFVDIKDCACCGAPTVDGGYLTFMCHNLGADQSADPFTPSWKLNGDYYQWGKKTPEVLGPSDDTMEGANKDRVPGWNRVREPDGAWNIGTEMAPIKSPNDPCPTGYRVPTGNELYSIYEDNTWFQDVEGAVWRVDPINYSSGKMFSPNLYLPAAGYRSNGDGSLIGRGNRANYWSSTEVGSTTSYANYFDRGRLLHGNYVRDRNYAWSVRCVANY